MRAICLMTLLIASLATNALAQPTPPDRTREKAARVLRTASRVKGAMEVVYLSAGGVRQVTGVIPYLLTLDAVTPRQPMPAQQIRVRFRLSNLVGGPVSGVVQGDIDGHPLLATSSAQISALAVGKEATGELWTYGSQSGSHTLHIKFANGVSSSNQPSFNPFEPHPIPHPLAAPFLAEDATDLFVGTPSPSLVTTDAPLDGAKTYEVCGGSDGDRFGFNPKVLLEWASVLPGTDVITPFSGTVVRTENSTADFPFAHPFGNDTEFFAVPDANFSNLLAASNSPTEAQCAPGSESQEYCEARDTIRQLHLSGAGALGFEIDRGLLDPAYRPRAGERVAAHGTWIVDCGHRDYHTEMHPPLIVARARVLPNNGELRGTLIARPYTLTQTYSPDNAPFFPHALGQLAKEAVSPSGGPISAEPVISSRPFTNPLVAQYVFAIPPTGVSGDLPTRVRYHFVTRPGVTVSLSHPDKYRVFVSVSMDPTKYAPAPAPSCTPQAFTPDQIDDAAGWSRGTFRNLSGAVSTVGPGAIDFLGLFVGIPPGTLEPFVIKSTIALNAGVRKLDCTISPPIIPPTAPSTTGSDNLVVEDATQPYPVAGWLVISWDSSRRFVQLTPAALRELNAAALAAVPTPP